MWLTCTHEAQEGASCIYLKISDQGFRGRWESLEQHCCRKDGGLCYCLGPTLLTENHFPKLLECSCSSRASLSPGERGWKQVQADRASWPLLLCPLPLSPVLEQSSAVTTPVWSQASDLCSDKKPTTIAPLQGLSLLEEPLLFFKLNSCSSSGRKEVCRGSPAASQAVLPRAKPQLLTPPCLFLAALRSRNTSRSKGTHIDFSPTYSLTQHTVYYSTVLLQPQTVIQFKLPFPTTLCFWHPHYIAFYGCTFVFVLFLTKKPTGLSQLVTTKEKKRDQLYFTIWFVSYNQSIR